MHASLIPVGPNRGKVLMWGFGHAAQAHLDWAIVDPIAVTVHKGQLQEAKAAELFCSSHAWTRDGRLFVAGGWNFQGTTHAPSSSPRASS